MEERNEVDENEWNKGKGGAKEKRTERGGEHRRMCVRRRERVGMI